MEPLAIHLNVSFADRRVLAPGRRQRRTLARLLGRLSAVYPILSFRIADTHVHVLVLGGKRVAIEIGRRIKAALVNQVDHPGPFNPTHCELVLSQRHLRKAFDYVLTQDEHHGTAIDPLHDGSNLPDLLALRQVATATRTTVREHLPRVRRADLLALYGIDDLVTCDTLDSEQLADAAAAVLALPDLCGRSAPVVALRTAAIRAVSAETSPIAAALGLHPSAVRRLRNARSEPPLVRAVQLQLDLRRRLAEQLSVGARFAPYALSRDRTTGSSANAGSASRNVNPK